MMSSLQVQTDVFAGSRFNCSCGAANLHSHVAVVWVNFALRSSLLFAEFVAHYIDIAMAVLFGLAYTITACTIFALQHGCVGPDPLCVWAAEGRTPMHFLLLMVLLVPQQVFQPCLPHLSLAALFFERALFCRGCCNIN